MFFMLLHVFCFGSISDGLCERIFVEGGSFKQMLIVVWKLRLKRCLVSCASMSHLVFKYASIYGWCDDCICFSRVAVCKIDGGY